MSSHDEFAALYTLLSNAVLRNKHSAHIADTPIVADTLVADEPIVDAISVEVLESTVESNTVEPNTVEPNTFTVDTEVIQLHPFMPPKKGRRPKKQK